MLGSDGLDLSARVDEQEPGLYEKRVGLTMAQRRAQPDLFRFDFSRTADGSFVPECSCCGGLGHSALYCSVDMAVLGAASAANPVEACY
jgi:hypothetical protein|eukprot:COSAG01_NODE_570_length_15328_cov_82.520783_8_plen_89_part_00